MRTLLLFTIFIHIYYCLSYDKVIYHMKLTTADLDWYSRYNFYFEQNYYNYHRCYRTYLYAGCNELFDCGYHLYIYEYEKKPVDCIYTGGRSYKY